MAGSVPAPFHVGTVEFQDLWLVQSAENDPRFSFFFVLPDNGFLLRIALNTVVYVLTVGFHCFNLQIQINFHNLSMRAFGLFPIPLLPNQVLLQRPRMKWNCFYFSSEFI